MKRKLGCISVLIREDGSIRGFRGPKGDTYLHPLVQQALEDSLEISQWAEAEAEGESEEPGE